MKSELGKNNVLMREVADPKINDSLNPDYQIYWTSPDRKKKGSCIIFTYGQGRMIAVAIFRMLYPQYQIASINPLV